MSDLIIIAEAGVNHNGSLKNALKLVDAAAKSKADFVKFQTYIAEDLVQRNLSCADYQKRNSTFDNQFKMLKKYELKIQDFKIILKRCKKRKIKFLSSPFDLDSINTVKNLKVETIKIPSGEITNIPYLQKIVKEDVLERKSDWTFSDYHTGNFLMDCDTGDLYAVDFLSYCYAPDRKWRKERWDLSLYRDREIWDKMMGGWNYSNKWTI